MTTQTPAEQSRPAGRRVLPAATAFALAAALVGYSAAPAFADEPVTPDAPAAETAPAPAADPSPADPPPAPEPPAPEAPAPEAPAPETPTDDEPSADALPAEDQAPVEGDPAALDDPALDPAAPAPGDPEDAPGDPADAVAPVPHDDVFHTVVGFPVDAAAPGLLANDEGQGLTASTAGLPTVSHGTVSVGADGSFHYQPDAGFIGTDTLQYRVNDGSQDSAAATVTIEVHDIQHGPVAEDQQFSILEDTTLTVPAPGFFSYGTDPDGDAIGEADVFSVSHGVFAFTSGSGGWTFTPDAGFTGVAVLSFQLVDSIGNTSNVASVLISVSAPDSELDAVDDAYDLPGDGGPVQIAAPGVLGNDTTTPDNGLDIVGVVAQPAHGTVVLNPDGSFVYTPEAGYLGPDQFSYQITDGEGSDDVAIVRLTPPADGSAIPAVPASPASPQPEVLAFTGSDPTGSLWAALLAMGAGLAGIVLARRSRAATR